MNNKISLCLICQNEEEVIERCLSHIYKYVDEINIVDGGSIDNTLKIIDKFKEEHESEVLRVNIIQKPFEQHFANQKNEALKLATMDWILWIDPDEIYEDDFLKSLNRLIEFANQNKIEAYEFPRKTKIDGYLHNIVDQDCQTRMWKNKIGAHFTGRIHESPTGFGRKEKANLWILHFKSQEQQQKDNEGYWDMGQQPPLGWNKVDGKWIKNG